MEFLAEEVSRFGGEHGCAVWLLPDGLHVHFDTASSVPVTELLEALHLALDFYLPDLEEKENEDSELAEWTLWLEQMLQQEADDASHTTRQVTEISQVSFLVSKESWFFI